MIVARVGPDCLFIMACLAGPRSNRELESTESESKPGRWEAGCRHIGNIAQPRDQGQEPKLKGIS